MTKAEIQRLRKLCHAATCGPWDRASRGPINLIVDPDGLVVIGTVATIADCTESPDAHREANVAFIAAARTALPVALDEIERLKKEVAVRQCALYELREKYLSGELL
jgi:hypothetical protein